MGENRGGLRIWIKERENASWLAIWERVSEFDEDKMGYKCKIFLPMTHLVAHSLACMKNKS